MPFSSVSPPLGGSKPRVLGGAPSLSGGEPLAAATPARSLTDSAGKSGPEGRAGPVSSATFRKFLILRFSFRKNGHARTRSHEGLPENHESAWGAGSRRQRWVRPACPCIPRPAAHRRPMCPPHARTLGRNCDALCWAITCPAGPSQRWMWSVRRTHTHRRGSSAQDLRDDRGFSPPYVVTSG